MNHEATIIRERKNRIARHLYAAHHELSEILWIHPNEAAVYLDLDQVQTLQDIQRTVDELLERHEVAEEGLKDAARRIA